GYSAFSTWTRGLAWAILGYAEELEFLASIDAERFHASVGLAKQDVIAVYEQAAKATADHYLDDCAAADGIVYWDDGAPGLAKLGDWRARPAEPYNDHEPVDSSASAIAAQGLLRLGRYLGNSAAGVLTGGVLPGRTAGECTGSTSQRYTQAGLTVARTLLAPPYLSESAAHQGLLLHSVYHRPNNWDHIPPGRKVPCGESSMWGDYHLLELAVYLRRLATAAAYLHFFD
ncbi:MAG: glycosyl hydrolase, partial [Tepidisphaerales bacterium]